MRYLIYVTIVFAQTVYADFNKFVEIRQKLGFDAACEKVETFYQETTSYYEKAFFEALKIHCIRHKYETSEEFKKLPKEVKKQYYAGITEQRVKRGYPNLILALDSDEFPQKDLLKGVGPAHEFPELYEKWQKKVIDRYLNNPAPAPNEDEGDVHSPVNFVRSDYESMIEVYVKNDKPEEAERLAREYGEIYSWTSQEDTKALIERIEKQKAYYEKKKQKEDAVKQKADPKKVTAKLTEAIEAYDEAKASTQANTSEGVAVKEDNMKNKESELSLHSIHEKYNLFIVAIVIVVGMYLVSLMRRKRS